jgi:putative transposase
MPHAGNGTSEYFNADPRVLFIDLHQNPGTLYPGTGFVHQIGSGEGKGFTAKAIRKWLARLGVKTLFIEPGSPWENGYIESFNGKLRDELLNREIFMTLEEAKVLIEQWRREYNQVRPHTELGF